MKKRSKLIPLFFLLLLSILLVSGLVSAVQCSGDCISCYNDGDGDGYGGEYLDEYSSCGYGKSTNNFDCNDGNGLVNICGNGYSCVGAPSGSCVADCYSNGNYCSYDTQCCSNHCIGGSCSTCTGLGGDCNSGSDCCDGFCCGGSCSDGACCGALGSTCIAGVNCCSNVCIGSADGGKCRSDTSSCSSYDGYGCSADGVDDVKHSLAAAGTCTDSGCDSTGHTMMDCSSDGDNVCTKGTDPVSSSCTSASGDACDSDAGGNFVQDGLCAFNEGGEADCVSSQFVVQYNSNYEHYFYWSDQGHPEALACDDSLSDGDWSKNGIVCGSSCVGDSDSDCCIDDDCDPSNNILCDTSDHVCKVFNVCYVDWDGDTFGSDLIRSSPDCSSGQACNFGTDMNEITNNVVAFDSSFDADIFDNDAFLLFLFLSLFH